ncbi:hypothetical protein GCM10010329_52970 [Streptomyces spiroverticillatus]|uniref:Uncharacterized protein n=1 Tax=Streptomyces finlayi TaxID=67296 RepID=A0A919CCQ1_9ACTN|nr:hypothetical protein [Streptomyces finlayi]GHA22970.1 hypothetical protein GCM10010329_52970 [Streptomyces spiroverticillatus]GHD04692.1 hypothetical protein GCM10010334_53900 [Streptomyces finlayi]
MTVLHDPTESREPATARPLENVLFGAALAAQRIPWIDAPARALGLTPLTRESLTRQLMSHLKGSTSGRPVRLHTPFGAYLAPLDADDAADLLARAHDAGALGRADHLTPEGRRHPVAPHAAVPVPPAFLRDVHALAAQEAAHLIAARHADATVSWEDWCTVAGRLARRVVLGEAAAEDTLLGDLLAAAGSAEDAHEYTERAAALHRRLARHLRDGGGLVDVAEATGEETAAAVEHTLDLLTQATTHTARQALALLAVQPALPAPSVRERAEAAVDEALRRYPPRAATSYEVLAPFRWHDVSIEAGTDVLCATAWLNALAEGPGAAPSLCAVPGECEAADLAVFTARALVTALAEAVEPVVLAPRLDPDDLPTSLPPATLSVALVAADGSATPAPSAEPAPAPAQGRTPAHYAALTRQSAHSLEEHAQRLAECARDSGWNHDAVGERSRMLLLAHAERCRRAAADVRNAARWLAH